MPVVDSCEGPVYMLEMWTLSRGEHPVHVCLYFVG